MEVYAYDAFCPKEVIEKEGVKAVASAEELYRTCDVISIHLPSTAETNQSLNYNLLGLLPSKAVLINTARKEVVHEDDLIRLMRERPDIRYMTDVKPSAHERFAELFGDTQRYFATPKKMGAQTAEANINAGIAAAKQVVEFLLSGKAPFRVNK
jgi:D-3-phosphoglycerate dehydrogenase